jgi:hypothetical protein
MKITARSALIAGVTTLTVSAVAAMPSVQPLPPPRPEIQLAAVVEPHLLQILLTDPARLLGPAVPIGTVSPPPAPAELTLFPNLADTIDNVYLAVEPWVQYGFQVAADLLGWVPWVGWLSGQIMVFYTFGEGMVASGAFNITDWMRGDGGVIENVVDFGIDVGLAFLYLGIDEWNYFLPPLPPLPFPYPPRPPHEGRPGPNLLTVLGLTETPEVGVTNAASDLVNAVYIPVRNTIDSGVNVLQGALAPIPLVSIAGDQVNLVWDNLVLRVADSVVGDLINPVLNAPLNINSYINGGIDVGATTVDALFDTGIAEVNYVLGFPLLAPVSAQAGELNRTSEVSQVPPIVKNSLGGIQSGSDPVKSGAAVEENAKGPLAEVADTVRSVRKEIRANVNAAVERRTNKTVEADEAVEAAGNGVVRAQGQVRGAMAKAADDVVNAVRAGRPGNAADDVANSPTTVARSLRDTAKKVVNEVREAAKDVRQAVKDGPAANDNDDDDDADADADE